MQGVHHALLPLGSSSMRTAQRQPAACALPAREHCPSTSAGDESSRRPRSVSPPFPSPSTRTLTHIHTARPPRPPAPPALLGQLVARLGLKLLPQPEQLLLLAHQRALAACRGGAGGRAGQGEVGAAREFPHKLARQLEGPRYKAAGAGRLRSVKQRRSTAWPQCAAATGPVFARAGRLPGPTAAAAQLPNCCRARAGPLHLACGRAAGRRSSLLPQPAATSRQPHPPLSAQTPLHSPVALRKGSAAIAGGEASSASAAAAPSSPAASLLPALCSCGCCCWGCCCGWGCGRAGLKALQATWRRGLGAQEGACWKSWALCIADQSARKRKGGS